VAVINNAVDIATLVILGISVLVGALQGLTGEVARLCGIVAGVTAAYHTARLWQRLVAQMITDEAARMQRGFALVVIILLVVLVTGAIVWHLVKRFLKLFLRQPTDGVLGIVFGLGRGIVLIVLLLCLGSYLLPGGETEDYVFWHSYTGKKLHPTVRNVRTAIGRASRPFWGEITTENTKDAEKNEEERKNNED
jgi:membrane protein required for colicin V production